MDKPTLDALKLKYDSSPAYAGSDLAAVIAEVERLRAESEALQERIDSGCCYQDDGCAEHRDTPTIKCGNR